MDGESSHNMNYAYVNGKIVPENKALVSVFDRGFVLGDGLFETMRAVDFCPEFLKDHYIRMKRSCKKLRFPMPLTQEEMGGIIFSLCKKSKISDAAVRITLTRGYYDGGLSLPKKTTPTLVITVKAVQGLPAEIYSKGVPIAISSINKAAASGVDSSVKTTNYLANIFAKAEADAQKCFEAILLGKKGEIAELSTASFFGVFRGKIVTPPLETGILPGITRKSILSLCKRHNWPVLEKPVFLNQIPRMQEAFLTSSVRGIVPINKIGGRKIPVPGEGSWTHKIMGAYKEMVKRDRAQFASRSQL